MVLTAFREDLPDWVKDNIQTTCTYCGTYIADNSDTGTTSARWCINPKCPGHMMYRAKALADYFGIKGFGPKTALSEIKAKKYETHFAFIPEWFGDKKPFLSLPDIATLACIEGYGDTRARQELSNYGTFEEYFATSRFPNPLLVKHKDELLQAEKYFDIKPPLAAQRMLVMGTGSFHGYRNRDEFFNKVNEAFGTYVNVIQTGKRKTGISYLIKELDAVDHSKSRIAYEQGIPIVTPSEFISILCSMFPYILEK